MPGKEKKAASERKPAEAPVFRIPDSGFRSQDPSSRTHSHLGCMQDLLRHTHRDTHPTRVALIEWAAHVGGES